MALDDSALTRDRRDGQLRRRRCALRGGAGFTGRRRDASDRVVYNTSTGSLYYDADGSGAGAAQLIATISGNPTIAATDIAVI